MAKITFILGLALGIGAGAVLGLALCSKAAPTSILTKDTRTISCPPDGSLTIEIIPSGGGRQRN